MSAKLFANKIQGLAYILEPNNLILRFQFKDTAHEKLSISVQISLELPET